jgi:phosphonate transport system permease protein
MFVVVLIWAAEGAEVSVTNIVTGVPNIIDYLSSMIPPDADILSRLGGPLAETFQIAIMAIIFSSLVSLPVSFLAAKNIMPNRVIYQTTRTILNTLRGIPPLLYALLFVAMVGLGPFAGVLALTLHCIGAMGRFFSEAIENINPEVINVVKATGANKIQIITHAIIPELGALIVGYILYYFEYNVRTSTVLGLVGAGGIGLPLMTSIHLFKYGEVATIILVIIVIITIMDRLSTMVRTKIIKGGLTI